MQDLSDEYLISKVKEGCSDSFKELSDRHSGTVVNTLQKYLKKMIDHGYSKFDMMQDKDVILYKACLNFDSNKGSKYSTWVTNQSRYFCLNFFKKNSADVSASFEENSQEEYFENPENYLCAKDEIGYVVDYIKNIRNDNKRKILSLRLLGKKAETWKTISDQTGQSLSLIKKIYRSEIKKIRKKLTFTKKQLLY